MPLRHVVVEASEARGGGNGRARGCFRALFQPGKYFMRISPHVRALNRRKKGAQTRAWGKRSKVAKARARAQRLTGDMQPGSPRMGSHKWKNMQWSRPMQREGLRERGRGRAQRSECTRCRVPGLEPAEGSPPLEVSHILLGGMM